MYRFTPPTLSVLVRNVAVITLMATWVGCSSGRIEQVEDGLEDLRSIQASQTQQLTKIEEDLRRLSGKVEELEHVSVGKTAELEQSLRQVSLRVPPPPGVPEDLLNRDDEAISSITGSAADQYRVGLGNLRNGNFEPARAAFESFYSSNPQTAFSDNALFWIGICYEKLGQCDRAILPYSDVFQKLPAEDMVPVALFRLAGCFEKLGSAKDAVVTLQKLVDEHPRSSYAPQAQEMLRRLQGRTGQSSGRKPRR